ncbi:MAG: DUF11 domain-containing protein [Pirellulales bacterium]|nr:DUF11 domain-containing protein [Pirellulales bacterium]
MKRLLFRLGALTGLVVVGLVAVVQAQRTLHRSQDVPRAEDTAEGAPARPEFSLEPVSASASDSIAQVQYQAPLAGAGGETNAATSDASYEPQAATGASMERAGGYFEEISFPSEPTAAGDQPNDASTSDVPGDSPWSPPAAETAQTEPQLLAAEAAAQPAGDESIELAQPAELVGEIIDPAADVPPGDEPALGPAAQESGDLAPRAAREPQLLVVEPEETATSSAGVADESHAPSSEAHAPNTRGTADRQTLNPFAEDQAARPSTRASRSRGTATNRLASAASELDAPADDVSEVGNGQPGGRDLEGVQAPSLAVEKLAPAEVQVGAQATFQTRVRNAGTVAAREVEIHDEVPRGARLVGTKPRAERGPRGELIWSIGTLRPGEEVIVSMDVTPEAEGELGSVATARFAADASMRTLATRPALALDVDAPADVLIGEQVAVAVRLTNTGTGAAANVVLRNQLPEQFEHPAGPDLEYSVGTLKPGEVRDVELMLKAVKPGKVASLLVAEGDGQLRADHRSEIEVLAPALNLAIEGPQKRYLNRQAEYTVTLANPGTAPAHNVELATRLSPGLEFVDANNLGEYDEQTRTVHWRLEELPAGESGAVVVTAVPIEEGQQRLLAQTASDDGLQAETEQVVLVEGIAGTSFEVVDASDPIEVGGETIYEIRVTNQGTKASSNISVVAVVPEGMKPTAADGPTGHAVQGSQVVFDPLDRLAPKAETTYRLKVQAQVAGDLRLRVQVSSDDMRTPVTKEESTRVYADE